MSDDADRAAIIELIHRNRIAVWTRNRELWESCFVHAPYTTRWGWWRGGGVFVRTGWEELAARARVGHPVRADNYAYETKVENLNLQVGSDMAWATFDQCYPDYTDPGISGPGLTREARVFEKHDGAWKIALLGFLDGNAARAGPVALRLDAAGTVLWQSAAAGPAIAASDDVVIRGNRLHFRDRTADRRLSAALHWAAGLDAVYMSTHGALPIVVEAGEGEPTHIYWVIADAGMIVFSFGNENASRGLDVAAMVYGLSPAQKQVAALVAEGLTLAAIAGRMGITAHTARTHLNRVFDKTGVRTQPALVRVLLTAIAPV
jgi:DNA-binding CsgD family transcriptional regulator